MPQVIDELVLEVGLDSKQFDAGRRALDDEFSKTNKSLEAFGKNVEEQGSKITEVFSVLKRGAVGILGAFIGGEAAAFIDKVATMDAHTGRLARSIGASTHELSAWQNMVRSVGGTTADANSVFAGLNDTFMGIRMGNQMPSAPLAALLSRAGINPRGNINESAALQQIMRFLAPQGPQQQRFWLQQMPGMNENMMFLLMQIMQSPEKMRNLREELERIGVASDKSAAQAAELQLQTSKLYAALDNLARQGFPVLTALVNALVSSLAAVTGSASSVAADVHKGNVGHALLGDFWDYMNSPGANWSGMWDMVRGRNPGASAAPPTGAAASGGAWTNFLAGLGYLESNYNAAAGNTTSSARGAFQFTDATARQAIAAGIPDPRVGTYDQQAAATMAFIQKFHPDAARAIAAGDMAKADALLKQRWPSLPGGSQPQGRSRYEMWDQITHGGGQRPPGNANVTIGNINVTSSKADPKAVADQIPDSMRRYSMLAGINSGLT